MKDRENATALHIPRHSRTSCILLVNTRIQMHARGTVAKKLLTHTKQDTTTSTSTGQQPKNYMNRTQQGYVRVYIDIYKIM